ncbi:hypothetical protein [Pseudogemmobacter sonorensis]|uniref:hypothetical protein n=1 Tax=Pseudogemmobacter sonorensis TaxID=2989681 RepID=UPI0036CF1D48
MASTRVDFETAVSMLPGLAPDLIWLAGPPHRIEAAPELFAALAAGHGPLKAVLRILGIRGEMPRLPRRVNSLPAGAAPPSPHPG